MQPEITYDTATIEDIEPIYQLCRKLILDYENLEIIDCNRVLWKHSRPIRDTRTSAILAFSKRILWLRLWT